jgi:GNAT superfamily N-acetyltransferase
LWLNSIATRPGCMSPFPAHGSNCRANASSHPRSSSRTGTAYVASAYRRKIVRIRLWRTRSRLVAGLPHARTRSNGGARVCVLPRIVIMGNRDVRIRRTAGGAVALEISTDRSRLDVGFIHRYLSEESYWAKGRALETVQTTIANSLCFGVYEDGRQIAFARVITDYAVFGYLADVFVAPTHRGRGVSKKLMVAIVAHPDVKDLQLIMLRTQDAHGLYAQFGFSALQNPSMTMAKRPPGLPPA